jgi:tetratricopeptide (TPR) repeat protein
MRRCAIHHIVATEFLAGALLIITPANAQMSRDWMVCTGKVQAAQPDQQVAACTAIIEAGQETPTNMAVAYCARGVAFDARDQFNRAIADYDESVRIGPKSPTGYRCRGYGNIARGALEEAISDFNEAIALDPDSASFLARGRAYRAKGDLARAIADYGEALRLDPNNAMAFNNRAAALVQRQDYGRAIEDLGNAIRLNPSSSEAFVNRGLAYAYQKEHDRAIADFTEAIRLDPKNAGAFTNRGVAYEEKGERARARADFDQARMSSRLMKSPSKTLQGTERGMLIIFGGLPGTGKEHASAETGASSRGGLPAHRYNRAGDRRRRTGRRPRGRRVPGGLCRG